MASVNVQVRSEKVERLPYFHAFVQLGILTNEILILFQINKPLVPISKFIRAPVILNVGRRHAPCGRACPQSWSFQRLYMHINCLLCSK